LLLLEGTLVLKQGALEASKALFSDFAKACNLEEGCLEFSFSVDVTNPDLLNLRERFVDVAAFEAHQNAAHTIAFKKELYALGVIERDVRYYEGVIPKQR